jgi:hypothetical protein
MSWRGSPEFVGGPRFSNFSPERPNVCRISLAIPLALLTLILIPVAAPAAVLVELFTSQGCPNCPRAEQVMERLDRDLGAEVVFLAFHVDIFDSPRFKDRFSRAEWTRRQAMYGRARFDASLSTPEAIVDGRTVLVGSDESGLRQAIAAARERSSVSVLVAPDSSDAATLRVVVERSVADGPGLDVLAASFERRTTTALHGLVQPLDNDHVVLSLRRLGRLAAGQRQAEFTVSKSSLPHEAGGFAAFVQDPRGFAVHGAAALEFPSLADRIGGPR